MDTNSSNRKKRNYRWLGVLVYLLIGATCGVLIMEYWDRAEEAGMPFIGQILSVVLLIAGMYAALVLQIIIHEAGHLVFGLLTGYRFSSFRIFNLMLVKESGRLRLRKLNIAGTGGQCLMCPPDLVNGTMPFMLYNFGGAIMNILASLVISLIVCFIAA